MLHCCFINGTAPRSDRRRAPVALCGPATIQVRRSRLLSSRCAAEIERLERIFALYRTDSEIARLNRDGHIEFPSVDLLTVLSQCQVLSSLSHGAFDVSVQPLWTLYADTFFRGGRTASRRAVAARNRAHSRAHSRQLASHRAWPAPHFARAPRNGPDTQWYRARLYYGPGHGYPARARLRSHSS